MCADDNDEMCSKLSRDDDDDAIDDKSVKR